MNGARPAEVVHYLSGEAGAKSEGRSLIAEEALTVEIIKGPSYAIMRTPGHDRELALGFLHSEGIIAGMGDVAGIAECPEDANRVRVSLARPGRAAERNLAVSSSCGLCGRMDLDTVIGELPAANGALEVPLNVLYELPGRARARQELFLATGGSHAAALFGAAGELGELREDLGRHNALDKVIGHALMSGTPAAGKGVFLSGRVSLEMMVKVARAGIPFVAAVSAASAAAVEVAERLGITLCGFVRGGEVTVYAHPERIGAAS